MQALLIEEAEQAMVAAERVGAAQYESEPDIKSQTAGRIRGRGRTSTKSQGGGVAAADDCIGRPVQAASSSTAVSPTDAAAVTISYTAAAVTSVGPVAAGIAGGDFEAQKQHHGTPARRDGTPASQEPRRLPGGSDTTAAAAAGRAGDEDCFAVDDAGSDDDRGVDGRGAVAGMLDVIQEDDTSRAHRKGASDDVDEEDDDDVVVADVQHASESLPAASLATSQIQTQPHSTRKSNRSSNSINGKSSARMTPLAGFLSTGKLPRSQPTKETTDTKLNRRVEGIQPFIPDPEIAARKKRKREEEAEEQKRKLEAHLKEMQAMRAAQAASSATAAAAVVPSLAGSTDVHPRVNAFEHLGRPQSSPTRSSAGATDAASSSSAVPQVPGSAERKKAGYRANNINVPQSWDTFEQQLFEPANNQARVLKQQQHQSGAAGVGARSSPLRPGVAHNPGVCGPTFGVGPPRPVTMNSSASAPPQPLTAPAQTPTVAPDPAFIPALWPLHLRKRVATQRVPGPSKRKRGSFVLLWMSVSDHVSDNAALDAAVFVAQQNGLPLICVLCVPSEGADDSNGSPDMDDADDHALEPAGWVHGFLQQRGWTPLLDHVHAIGGRTLLVQGNDGVSVAQTLSRLTSGGLLTPDNNPNSDTRQDGASLPSSTSVNTECSASSSAAHCLIIDECCLPADLAVIDEVIALANAPSLASASATGSTASNVRTGAESPAAGSSSLGHPSSTTAAQPAAPSGSVVPSDPYFGPIHIVNASNLLTLRSMRKLLVDASIITPTGTGEANSAEDRIVQQLLSAIRGCDASLADMLLRLQPLLVRETFETFAIALVGRLEADFGAMPSTRQTPLQLPTGNAPHAASTVANQFLSSAGVRSAELAATTASAASMLPVNGGLIAALQNACAMAQSSSGDGIDRSPCVLHLYLPSNDAISTKLSSSDSPGRSLSSDAPSAGGVATPATALAWLSRIRKIGRHHSASVAAGVANGSATIAPVAGVEGEEEQSEAARCAMNLLTLLLREYRHYTLFSAYGAARTKEMERLRLAEGQMNRGTSQAQSRPSADCEWFELLESAADMPDHSRPQSADSSDHFQHGPSALYASAGMPSHESLLSGTTHDAVWNAIRKRLGAQVEVVPGASSSDGDDGGAEVPAATVRVNAQINALPADWLLAYFASMLLLWHKQNARQLAAEQASAHGAGPAMIPAGGAISSPLGPDDDDDPRSLALRMAVELLDTSTIFKECGLSDVEIAWDIAGAVGSAASTRRG